MSKELRVNRRFESLAEAQEAAKRELHDHNRRENTGSITMMGNPTAAAGLNIAIEDAGVLSGKYHIDSVVHDYSPGSGYTSTLNIRMGAPEAVMPKQTKDKTGKKKKASASGPEDDGGTYTRDSASGGGDV